MQSQSSALRKLQVGNVHLNLLVRGHVHSDFCSLTTEILSSLHYNAVILIGTM